MLARTTPRSRVLLKLFTTETFHEDTSELSGGKQEDVRRSPAKWRQASQSQA